MSQGRRLKKPNKAPRVREGQVEVLSTGTGGEELGPTEKQLLKSSRREGSFVSFVLASPRLSAHYHFSDTRFEILNETQIFCNVTLHSGLLLHVFGTYTLPVINKQHCMRRSLLYDPQPHRFLYIETILRTRSQFPGKHITVCSHGSFMTLVNTTVSQ